MAVLVIQTQRNQDLFKEGGGCSLLCVSLYGLTFSLHSLNIDQRGASIIESREQGTLILHEAFAMGNNNVALTLEVTMICSHLHTGIGQGHY